MRQGPVEGGEGFAIILSEEVLTMGIPIPAETPDPNIDDPTIPQPVPEQEPEDPPGKTAPPPTIGDPPSDEPPARA